MIKFISFIVIFLSLIGNKLHAQEVLSPGSRKSIDEFYKSNFSIFDTIKKQNDTLYFLPFKVEHKLTIIDTVSVKSTDSNFDKVFVNSYIVSINGKNENISYYRAPKSLDLNLNRELTHTYQLPYNVWNPEKIEISYWTKDDVIGLDLNQGTFSNWSAGGYNSISGIIKGDFKRFYEKGRNQWGTELKVRYGVNKQENQELRKTDDVLTLNSTYGYRTSVTSNWYYTGKLTLNTQMANGYSYPNVDTPISKIFAPAYLFLGIGAEYSSKEKEFQIYISPATQKSTFVLDDDLANSGAFGVEKAIYDDNNNLIRKGKRSRNEIGFLITNQYKKQLFKNVVLDHKLVVYTDYLHDFGNIDVDWQLHLEMKINNYVKATLGGQLIYDDDINIQKEVNGVMVSQGPRIQIKQLLSIGLTYKL